MEWHAPRGGGKRLESSCQRGAKVGRHCYADSETDLDAKRQRGEEAESVSGIATISRNSSNNEKSIQSYPSPEFLNSLLFIKKFYPVLNLLHAPRVPQKQRGCSLLHLLAIRTRCTPSVRKSAAPRWGEGKFIKVAHENSSNLRHSEALLSRKNLADYNVKQLQGIKINSTETDHASMPLGIFASKSVSHKTNVGGVGTPPYVAKPVSCRHSNADLHLAASLPSRLAAKKSAFTLAEVLITLGIIGVVAALTLPSVIQNYKKQEVLSRLKKSYAVIEQTVKMAEKDYGAITTWPEWSDSEAVLHKYFVPYLSGVKEFGKAKSEVIALCYDQNSSMTFDNVFKYYSQYVWWTGVHSSNPFSKGETSSIALSDGTCIGLNPETDSLGVKPKMIFVDVNGSRRGPNVAGKDLFFFYINSEGFVKPWGDGYQEVILKNLCNSQSSSRGYTCAARIIREGWQINYW